MADPVTAKGVPVYLHDWFGPGRTAKVVATNAPDKDADGLRYAPLPSVTGEESVAAEVSGVEFPELLHPVDDLPPATVILSVRRDGVEYVVRGVSHDNGEIARVMVNDREAKIVKAEYGVADWEARVAPADGKLVALAVDAAGNAEQLAHQISTANPAEP